MYTITELRVMPGSGRIWPPKERSSLLLWFRLGFLITFTIVSGCQTQQLEMSTEEAQAVLEIAQIKLDFQPSRTIRDVRDQLGDPAKIPPDCDDQIAKHRENLELLFDDLSEMPISSANFVMLEANTELARGSFNRAISLQHWSESKLSQWQNFQHVNAMAGLALLYGAAGNARLAARYTAKIDRSLGRGTTIHSQGLSTVNTGARALAFKAIGRASTAIARGDVDIAEPQLRAALHYGVAFKYGLTSINRPWLHAQLVSVLLQQGKLLEAEVAARDALQEQLAYGAHASDAGSGAAMLAAVLAEQGRLADAEFAAIRAINLYESECAFPEALPYVQARQILIEVLAAAGNWERAYAEIVKTRNGLASQQYTFERLYHGVPEIGLAMIYGGEEDLGLSLLRARVESIGAESGEQSVEYAEALGLLATGLSMGHREHEAEKYFRKILPMLLEGAALEDRTGSANRQTQRRLVLGTALGILSRPDSQTGALDSETLDLMFRISQTIRLTRVQGAISASAVRSAAQGEVLAALVRDEQDARDRLANTLESLSYLSLAPAGEVDPSILAALRNNAQELRLAIAAMERTITDGFPSYTDLIRPSALSLDETQTLLKTGESLIRVHVERDRTLVWAVPASGDPEFIKLEIGRNFLAPLISRLRDAVDPQELETLADIPEFDINIANEIYRLLLAPVEAAWKHSKHLYIVADAPLDVIPFSTLVVTDSSSAKTDSMLHFSAYRNVKWLAKSHASTTLPAVSSLRSLKLLSDRPSGIRPFVGFGAPDFGNDPATEPAGEMRSANGSIELVRRKPVDMRGYDSAQLAMLPPLPETAEELQQIAKALGANPRTDVFVGSQASEQRVMSMQLSLYRVIAFATHGLVPGDLDGLDQPALALSAPVQQNSQYDGLLTVDEIVSLKLGADWAVLSACNTGSADGKGAEALSGLGRAFLYAGARALLVSNWPVHSEVTKVLVSDIFVKQSLLQLDRSEALRLAQVELLLHGNFLSTNGSALFSYAHPIFWAPFTIDGDGSNS